MPYSLSKNGKCVIKSDSGAVVKCHKDKRRARAHLAALRVNVQEVVRLTEVGARNNRVDLKRIQAAHDTLVELGAMCQNHDPQMATESRQRKIEAIKRWLKE